MTEIHLNAAEGRARLETRAGALVPRVIHTGPASARVALVAGGALLLGGDRVRLDVTVGAGCTLELEDIGGTVAYNADGHKSEWIVDVTVEAGALLIWHGLPFVVADGANVDRRTSIILRGPGATACLRETIVLGRTGERGGIIDLRTSVLTIATTSDEKNQTEPLFVERLVVRGTEPVPGVIGTNRVMDSLLYFGGRAPAVAPAVLGATEILELEGPATIARSLQHEAHRSVLTTVWDDWCASALAVQAAGLVTDSAADLPEPHTPEREPAVR